MIKWKIRLASTSKLHDSNSSDEEIDDLKMNEDMDVDMSDNLEINEDHNTENDLLEKREQNIKELNSILSEFFNTEEGKQIKQFEQPLQNNKQTATKRRRRNSEIFHASVPIPRERRTSNRLKNHKPDFTYEDLPHERDIQASYKENIDDLEKVVYMPKRQRLSSKRIFSRIVPVDEITDDYILNIAINSSEKKYCKLTGSSCHQCRQKTLDSKTYCRSGKCFGVRGQFCGPCLRNRYGEDPIEALKNPHWSCPVCRNICNCSFCRSKQGKRPTGILAPLAQQEGHASVHHFLASLNGYGDFIDDKQINEENDPLIDKNNLDKCLLGFTIDGKPVLKNDEKEEFLLGFDLHLKPVMHELD